MLFRSHKLYPIMNQLIKESLNYISQFIFPISGHLIDIRKGLIYISLVGMQASDEERKNFKNHDKQYNLRETLINILNIRLRELGYLNEISVLEGGTVGISIFPSEYDKSQILHKINIEKYDEIIYFGDKYLKSGNDYKMLNDNRVTGYKIRNIEQTYSILELKYC